jgi:hypothetical protein
MRIAIARLRSGVKYVGPLNHIIDSFCECLVYFMAKNKQHEYSFYNITFDGSKPVRDLKALERADVIIIPSEAEFTYNIPGRMHPQQVKRSNDEVAKIIPYLKGKKVIILRSDRRDDKELYAKVLGTDYTYDEIDEIDFPNNIHSLKYHYIVRHIPLLSDDSFRYDFCYWGTDKRKGIDGKLSGDERHLVLKGIQKDKSLSSLFIGSFYGFKRDVKFSAMKDILHFLRVSRTTLCFNWMDNKATTSRYIEAIASGMYPFVWGNYDSTGIFVKNDWQRVHTIKEFVDKVKSLDYNYYENYDSIHHSFKKNLLSEIAYYDLFEEKLKGKL